MHFVTLKTKKPILLRTGLSSVQQFFNVRIPHRIFPTLSEKQLIDNRLNREASAYADLLRQGYGNICLRNIVEFFHLFLVFRYLIHFQE